MRASRGNDRPILIAGPTAGGKSALALALAERHGGVVINADASQVYGCWRVLTARPDDADLSRASHRLYGHVPASVRYSAGDWLRAVEGEIAAARGAGLCPIVVGGTGLYFHVLTCGLAAIPPIPPEVRARSQAMVEAGDVATMLAALDPETRAGIDTRNPMRVQRAWDVLQATGRGLARWHAEPQRGLVSPTEADRFVLTPDIDILNNNINMRFHAMVEVGALDEVRAFAASDPDWSLPSALALGARPLASHLAGVLSLAEATEASITATRQFAKRQRTWFRNRMADWPRLVDPRAIPDIR